MLFSFLSDTDVASVFRNLNKTKHADKNLQKLPFSPDRCLKYREVAKTLVSKANKGNGHYIHIVRENKLMKVIRSKRAPNEEVFILVYKCRDICPQKV